MKRTTNDKERQYIRSLVSFGRDELSIMDLKLYCDSVLSGRRGAKTWFGFRKDLFE